MTLITPAVVSAQVARHDAKWASRRGEMRLLRHAYETRFWDEQADDASLRVETARAYEYVEGYVASLFSRNPSVVVKADLRGRGDPRKVAALCNQFVSGVRKVVEDASRSALIFPMAFLKVTPCEAEDVYRRVKVVAVEPWDVVLDMEAPEWDDQRWVGHRYWVPVSEARRRWGRKDYATTSREDWLTSPSSDDRRKRPVVEPDPDEEYDQFVQVVEVYDMADDRLLIWSPQYSNGEKWLYDGISIEVDGSTQKISRVPFRTVDDRPLLPVVPLYYNRLPYAPLEGYSALWRVYGQVREWNILRTYQANAVRKASRQWLVRKDRLSADQMARLAAGVDGEFIEVELEPGESLSSVVEPVPHSKTPPETYDYLAAVDQDFSRGSVIAPFTRGDATKATATEVTALAAYSSSEIGRMARERDSAVEALARLYVAVIRLYLGDDGRDLVLLDGRAQVVTSADLAGDFSFYAQDSGSTPVSEAVRKQEFANAVPLLLQLGVPREMVLAEVVRLLDLPETFAGSGAPAPAPPMPPVTPAAAEVVEDQQLGLGPGGLPSPDKISRVLP